MSVEELRAALERLEDGTVIRVEYISGHARGSRAWAVGSYGGLNEYNLFLSMGAKPDGTTAVGAGYVSLDRISRVDAVEPGDVVYESES